MTIATESNVTPDIAPTITDVPRPVSSLLWLSTGEACPVVDSVNSKLFLIPVLALVWLSEDKAAVTSGPVADGLNG